MCGKFKPRLTGNREKGRDDCPILSGLCTAGERTVRAQGNRERPNAPPAQDSGSGTLYHVSLIRRF
jgi:hypothetical protein